MLRVKNKLDCLGVYSQSPLCISRTLPLFSDFYNKDWANQKLRFAIATLQDESSLWKGKLQFALSIKQELIDHGYVWQARRLENWIHRLQAQEKQKDQARIGSYEEKVRPKAISVTEFLQSFYSSSELTSKRETEEVSF